MKQKCTKNQETTQELFTVFKEMAKYVFKNPALSSLKVLDPFTFYKWCKFGYLNKKKVNKTAKIPKRMTNFEI